MQFSMRNSFKAEKDAYKYKVSVGLDRLKINLNPPIISNIISFHQFVEGHSYQEDLKRYRPLIRLQTIIDVRARCPNQKLPKHLEKTRKALVRDWFRIALWYVRLRKASRAVAFTYRRYQDLIEKGFDWSKKSKQKDTEASEKAYWPHSLLEVEARFQADKGKLVDIRSDKGIKMVKKTNLVDSEQLKIKVRKKSQQEDSDDFSKGYDSTSSEDAESLMYQLEHMELDGRHVSGSTVALKAHMIYQNQKQKAMEDFADTDEGKQIAQESKL